MRRFVVLTVAGVGSLIASANAQTTIHTVTGTSAMQQLGRAVAFAGDVNHDGFGDFIVGEPFNDTNGADSGTAQVFSGRNGSLLYTFNGLAAGDRFGESVARAGDINKDGYGDVIVGAPQHDHNASNTGMARVFSGRDGSTLATFYGVAAGDWCGLSVDYAGDVNNDGWDDVIVGSPYGKGNPTSNVGVARVFSGRDGSILHTFVSTGGITLLGDSVSGAGDVDKDGFDDLIVGAPEASYVSGQTESGRAWLFSGRTGGVLRTWDGVGSGTNLGCSVDGAGDVNDDGYPDLVVGIVYADYNGGNSGSAEVFSGRNGSLLYRFNGDHSQDELGASVAGAGDVDGDGYFDIVAGSKMNDFKAANAGMARVYSGRTGQILYSTYGAQVDEFYGYAVAGGGDLDGDGLSDVLVGWPTADFNGQDSGRVRSFSARPLPITMYCVAKTNSLGCKAQMGVTGTPSASSSSAFIVRATQVLNQDIGLLFYGHQGQSTPFQGGTLCVRAPYMRTPVVNSGGSSSGNDCSGVLSRDMNAWIRSHNDPTLGAGDTIFAQWWYRDANASYTSGYSNGVYFTVMP